MKRIRPMLALAAGLTAVPVHAMTQNVLPAFRDTWVPTAAPCTSPLKVTIDAQVVTFYNGTERAEFKKLEQCASCMGRDVQNVTLLSTDAMGDSPWMLTLDGRKKVPSVSVDLSNDKKLAARFPLGGNAHDNLTSATLQERRIAKPCRQIQL